MLKRCGIVPSHGRGLADIEEFTGSTVRSGSVPFYGALKAYNTGHHFRQRFDRYLLASAGIDGFVAAIIVHQEEAKVGKVVDIQEFAQRAAIAPANHLFKMLLLGLVETTNQSREDMAMLGVVVVVRAVEVGGHHADEVGAILSVEIFAILKTADFGEGVGLVGGFQAAGEEAGLRHGLRGETRIDAAAAKELEFLHTMTPSGIDNIHLEHHILIHEISRGFIVGYDTANLSSGKKYIFRFFGGEKILNITLLCEVELGMRTCHEVVIALPLQLPHYGAAYHSLMASNIDFRVFVHF